MSAFDTLSAIPSAVTSGEAVTWVEPEGEYPTTAYAIAYKFSGQTPQDGYQTFAIAGTEASNEYTFAFGTSVKPGVYQWEKQVTRASDSAMRVVATGAVVVMANLATTPTVTAAQTMLTALETAITTLSASVNSSVSFNGQSYTKADMRSLLEQRVRLQAEIYRQQQAILNLSGNARNPVVHTRFAPQSGGY